MPYKKCVKCGQYIRDRVTQKCLKGCDKIIAAVQDAPINQVSIYDLHNQTYLDPETCEAFHPEQIPEPLRGCDLYKAAIEGQTPTEKPLEEIVFYHIDNDAETCIPVTTSFAGWPVYPGFCERVHTIDLSSPTLVDMDVPQLGDPLSCSPISLTPPDDVCTELQGLDAPQILDWSEVQAYGRNSNDDDCAKIQTGCPSTDLQQADQQGGDVVSIQVGEYKYNSYLEGGQNFGSVHSTILLTNDTNHARMYEVVGEVRVGRIAGSELTKAQAINYQGPVAYVPTGTGSATLLGTTSFSGLAEEPDNTGSIGYVIGEVPYSLVNNGYGGIFPEYYAQDGSFVADTNAYSWGKQQKTFHAVLPGESVEIVSTTVLAIDNPVATQEDFLLEHNLYAQSIECVEIN